MRKLKRISKIMSVFLAFVLMLSAVPVSSSAAARKISDKYVIQIYRTTANIRNKPSLEDSKVIARAQGGTKLGYYGFKSMPDGDVWYKVRINDKTDGWVSGQVGKKISISKTPPLPDDASAREQLSDYIMRVSEYMDVVGTQVAVIRGSDGKCFSWKWGYATKEKVKMTSDVKIRVASISKVAVAMCAVSMQEKGIVGLKKNIGNYWGSKLPVANSLKTLLTHTSTLRYLEFKPTAEETLAQLKNKNNYLSGKPGSKDSWYYNNYASGIAGATLEMAGNCILDDYAKENIFEPLGINATFFSGRLPESDTIATLYEENGTVERTIDIAREIVPSENPGDNAASYMGGLTTTARDLAKLFSMLANDGEYNGVRVLEPESVELMEKKSFTAKEYGGTFKQCLALRYKKNVYNTSEMYYHTANAYGVLAIASYNPTTRDTVVVITIGGNAKRDSEGIYDVCGRITSKTYALIDEL